MAQGPEGLRPSGRAPSGGQTPRKPDVLLTQLCAQCSISLESASLLLACDHHLCLLCAAHGLAVGGPGSRVRCHVCNCVTEVDATAAQYLDGLRPDSARTTASGGNGPSSLASSSATPVSVVRLPSAEELLALQRRPPGGAGPGSAHGSSGAAAAAAALPTVPATAPEQTAPKVLQPWPRPMPVPAPVGRAASGLSAAAARAASPAAAAGRPASSGPPGSAHSLAAPASSSSVAVTTGQSSGNVSEIGAGLKHAGLPLRPLPPLSTQSVSAPPAPRGRSPRQLAALTWCGQCGERPVELSCEQCDEVFCRSCAIVTHRRGRMSDHRLLLRGASPAGQAAPGGGGGGACSSSAAAPGAAQLQAGPLGLLLDTAAVAHQPPAPGSPLRRSEPVPLPRRFLRCPVHVEEPLQYFCLRCQCNCICAECVLNGDHRGHEVLNVREAVRQLPDRVEELAAAARLRAEEIAGAAQRVREGRRELAAVAERGQKELRAAGAQLAQALQREEDALVAEVDRCDADVAEVLRIDAELHIGEALEELRRHREAGDAALALTWYARLKKAVDAPPAEQPDADRVAAQLRGQLQRGFEGRLAGLAGLTACLSELRMPQLLPPPGGLTPQAAAKGPIVAPLRSQRL